jgi:hypothetical protein
LDHIDGDRGNNLLNNLRIICPNCNATLPTHCGKNKKPSKKSIIRKKTKSSNKQNKLKNKNKALELKKGKIKKVLINSDIDFSTKTWGTESSKLLDWSPQYCLKYIKKNISELLI